jgi:hypothetical protein
MNTFQEHFTSSWKTAESDTETTDTAKRGTKDETKEKCSAATVELKIGCKPLDLLQVNYRSIYNKILDI